MEKRRLIHIASGLILQRESAGIMRIGQQPAVNLRLEPTTAETGAGCTKSTETGLTNRSRVKTAVDSHGQLDQPTYDSSEHGDLTEQQWHYPFQHVYLEAKQIVMQ